MFFKNATRSLYTFTERPQASVIAYVCPKRGTMEAGGILYHGGFISPEQSPLLAPVPLNTSKADEYAKHNIKLIGSKLKSEESLETYIDKYLCKNEYTRRTYSLPLNSKDIHHGISNLLQFNPTKGDYYDAVLRHKQDADLTSIDHLMRFILHTYSGAQEYLIGQQTNFLCKNTPLHSLLEMAERNQHRTYKQEYLKTDESLVLKERKPSPEILNTDTEADHDFRWDRATLGL